MYFLEKLQQIADICKSSAFVFVFLFTVKMLPAQQAQGLLLMTSWIKILLVLSKCQQIVTELLQITGSALCQLCFKAVSSFFCLEPHRNITGRVRESERERCPHHDTAKKAESCKMREKKRHDGYKKWIGRKVFKRNARAEGGNISAKARWRWVQVRADKRSCDRRRDSVEGRRAISSC